MLDVLTLNVWGDNGPVDERMDLLAAWLRERRPDIIGLQEVEGFAGGAQAAWLAAELDYPTVLCVRAGDAERPGEGLAVVSVLDGEPAETVALPEAPRDGPRALQQVDLITADGRALRVANTHLAWRLRHSEQRRGQTETIAAALAGWTGPVVLTGDLNDVAGSPALAVLTDPAGPGLVDCCSARPGGEAGEGTTFDLANPHLWQPQLAGRRVDHVLVRGFAARDVAVVLDGRRGPIVSDHYGVLVRLEGP